MKVNSPHITVQELLKFIHRLVVYDFGAYWEIMNDAGWKEYSDSKFHDSGEQIIDYFLPTLSQAQLNIIYYKLRAKFKTERD